MQPAPDIKHLRYEQLVDLLKATTDAILSAMPDDCRLEDAAGDLEDAVAVFSAASKKLASGELDGDDWADRADFLYEMERDRRMGL